MTVRHSNYEPTRSDEDSLSPSLSMSFSEGKKHGRMRRARMAGRLSVMWLGPADWHLKRCGEGKEDRKIMTNHGKMMKHDEQS